MTPLNFRIASRVGVCAAMAVLAGCSGGSSAASPAASATLSPSSNTGPQLYQLASGSSGTITEPPAGTLGLKTLDLAFTATAQNQAVLVDESGYTKTFALTSQCTASAGAATGAVPATAIFTAASPTSGTGPAAVLTITAGATGGTCTFTITDANTTAQSAVIFVGTTLTAGSVQ